jgi:hypothetical protein
MKRLMTLVVAVGAWAGVQAVSATPAEAGWCGYSYYRSACCPRYYRTVRHYRPILRKAVKRVVYYRVVGYRAVKVRHYRRGCC